MILNNMCSQVKIYSKSVSLWVKNAVEVEMTKNWKHTESKFAKIMPFSKSCCDSPTRPRLKVDVYSGSPAYEGNLLWYGPIILT